MTENTPVISKAKAQIDDHLDWALVHFKELEAVNDEISNSDFSGRCGDIYRELIGTLPHFSLLYRLGKTTDYQFAQDSMTFDQLLEGEFSDDSIAKWAQEKLDMARDIATATSAKIRERKDVKLDFTLRRRLPASWLAGDEQPQLLIPNHAGPTVDIKPNLPLEH